MVKDQCEPNIYTRYIFCYVEPLAKSIFHFVYLGLAFVGTNEQRVSLKVVESEYEV